MKPPPFSVVSASLAVFLGAHIGVIESKTIFATFYGEKHGYLIMGMALFALLIAAYRRPKSEMVGMCLSLAALPFVTLYMANKWSVDQPFVPSNCFELSNGAWFVAVGAIAMMFGYVNPEPDEKDPPGQLN
jgi:hypothetical protein